MGTSNSKNSTITIKSIRSSTEDIRSTLRRSKRLDQTNKEHLHQVLIDNSKKLNTLRSKKPKKKQLEIDQIQKFVSDVSEELLDYNDSTLDKNTDESHSFIHIDPSKLHPTKPSKQIKITSKNKDTLQKLDEIEEKLTRVKNDVNIGLKTDDINFLKLQKKKIEMLSTDLEMLLISETSEMNEIKQNLEKDLYKYYQKILRRERKQQKLLNESTKKNDENIEKNKNKLNSLNIMLEDVQDILQNFSKGDTRGDLPEIETELKKIETQLGQIDVNDMENMKSKTKISKKLKEIRKQLNQIESEEESKKMEEIVHKIDEIKDKQDYVDEIKSFQKELGELQLEFQENKDFKEEYLDELKKTLDKIDPNHDGVVLRPKLKKSKSVENLIRIKDQFMCLEKEIRVSKPEEARKLDDLLEQFENSIRRKRRSLADVYLNNDVIKTNVKLSELPKLQSLKTNDVSEIRSSDETDQKINYGNIEKLMENLTKISDRLDELSTKIDQFEGTSEDLQFNFLAASLFEKKSTLGNLHSRVSSNQIDVYKKNILQKIELNQRKLNEKLIQNTLEKRIGNTREKVNRFSGNFQNIQYKTIEHELNDIETRNQQINNENIKNETNSLRKVLKEKSQAIPSIITKENFTNTLQIIKDAKEIVQSLLERLQKSIPINQNENSNIELILNTKTVELNNLNIKNDTPLFHDVQDIQKTIEKCRNLLETRDEIEIALNRIDTEILNFDGSITDDNYSKLNEELNYLETKLNRIDCEEKSNLNSRIKQARSRFERVASDSEKIWNFERRVRQILEMDVYIPENSDRIDEELIDLKINLEKMDVTETLSYRKITLLNYIEYLLRKINEKNGAQVSKGVIV